VGQTGARQQGKRGRRTDAVDCADLLDVLESGSCLDLDHREERLVGREHVLGRRQAMCDGREGRTLSSEPLRRELGIVDDRLRLGCGIDLRDHDAAVARGGGQTGQGSRKTSESASKDALSSRVERALDDVGARAPDTDDRADAERTDGGDTVVHRLVADVAVLAVDDDAVEAGEGEDLGVPGVGDGREGHERELARLEPVEQAEPGVSDGRRVGGRVAGSGHGGERA
jgi:hypothetical protein